MDEFDKKVSDICSEVSGVSFEQRAYLRLGIIRNLSYISQWDHFPENFDEEKPILLYGAGQFGEAAANFLLAIGVSISAFIDNGKAGEVRIIMGTSIPIISFEQCVERYPNAYINITVADTEYYFEIKQSLDKLGIRFYDIVGYYVIAGLKKLYTLLDDNLSRIVLLDSLKYLTGYSRYYEHYFDKRLVSLLTSHEVFVDAGMYNGDTIFDFIAHVKGKYRHIYGFEANQNVFNKYKERLKGLHNATLEDKGLWSHETVLAFGEGVESSSSFVTEYYTKSDAMAVTSLDKYFLDIPKPQWPTFIKIDIEGAEYEALLGAKVIIQAAKPKMAISVYHKTEDFWRIPELLKKYHPEYSFFLRHYSSDDAREYVLYAV